MMNILLWFNLLFYFGFMHINDEFVIFISLFLVFAFLWSSLRKYLLWVLFFVFDGVFLKFNMLVLINIYAKKNTFLKNIYFYFLIGSNFQNNYYFENYLFLRRKIVFFLNLKKILFNSNIRIKLINSYNALKIIKLKQFLVKIAKTVKILKNLNSFLSIFLKNKNRKFSKIFLC